MQCNDTKCCYSWYKINMQWIYYNWEEQKLWMQIILNHTTKMLNKHVSLSNMENAVFETLAYLTIIIIKKNKISASSRNISMNRANNYVLFLLCCPQEDCKHNYSMVWYMQKVCQPTQPWQIQSYKHPCNSNRTTQAANYPQGLTSDIGTKVNLGNHVCALNGQLLKNRVVIPPRFNRRRLWKPGWIIKDANVETGPKVHIISCYTEWEPMNMNLNRKVWANVQEYNYFTGLKKEMKKKKITITPPPPSMTITHGNKGLHIYYTI